MHIEMAGFQQGGLPPIQLRNDRHSPNMRLQASRQSGLLTNFGALQYSENPHAGAVQWEMDNAAEGGIKSLQEKRAHTTMVQEQMQAVEIAMIEEQLHNRRQLSEHTDNSVKSLEIQHVGSISDLRQRVGRCDISIAKLSGDVRKLNESLMSLTKQTQENHLHQARVIEGMENKISRLESQLSKHTSEQHLKVDSIGVESKQSMALLATKTKTQFEEMQRTIDTMRMKGDSEHQLVERGLSAMVQLAVSKRDSQQEHFAEKILNRLDDLDKVVVKIEGRIYAQSDKLKTKLEDKMKRFELQVQQKQDVLENELKQDMEDIEQQHDAGFKRVKDSMATMRTVLEGKQQLLAENLHKQLANVKKLVVLT
ncbi:protein FAM81A-like isoform X2 [Asterias amurensis]|uniref:protein FAM81A-like isoform X2 n=1 Tax=Asterias amurensis TaxID=7602 RepID=UPI003AB154D5